jgi:hypothetical protein
MTRKIHKAGRVPKTAWGRLGLPAGSDFEDVTHGPVDRKPSLVKEGSFLVHTGEIPAGYDILKAIDEDREERMRQIWGQ